MSPAVAMNVAARERSTQYARKYTVLHKISEWESRLDTAKGKVHEWESHLDTAKGKVHECEGTLQKLREEVEAVDANLGKLESGMEHLKHAMQHPQHPRNFVAGFPESLSSTASSNAITSPLHEHDHQTRWAMGDTMGIT
jgi:hypothetical protein